MRVRYLGDLHLEYTDMLPAYLPSVGEDLVVLAGDIAPGLAGIQWAQVAIPDRPVVYVLGNHEFHGEDFDRLIVEARATCSGSQVHLLENSSIEFMGCRILGCTLWTDFRLFGESTAERAADFAEGYMPDFTEVRRLDRFIVTQDMVARCRESRAWLDAEIEGSAQPLLVVTHHAPSFSTMNPRYAGAISSAAFHNDFDDLMRRPVRAWIHGHSHHSTVKRVNGIPLLTNQRGYPMEASGDFSWERVLEI